MMIETDSKPIVLRDLYRLTTLSGLDADTLVRYASGSMAGDERAAVATRLAAVPEAQALADLLAELAPDSARLAAAVQVACDTHHAVGRQAPRHVVHATAARHARHRRGAAWLSAAAVLALAFGLWGWHHHDVLEDAPAIAAQPASDNIFDSGMDGHAAAHQQDEIFRSNFRSDRIFNSAFNHSS